ncbi:MAG: rod shape-determining protein RodA [Chitinophagaceae bacterium]
MKKIFFLAASVFALSCNNSSKDEANTSDTMNMMTTDTVNHSNMTTTGIPALPAIPENAKVYFKNLKNNATVTSPVKVEMAIDNMRVDTTGSVVAGSGHFHILIDAEDSIAMEQIVPKDSTHLHYGKGQTEDNLTLSPGKHKLTLQFADGVHRSYGSKLATTITINVKK